MDGIKWGKLGLGLGTGILRMGIAYICVLVNVLPRRQKALSIQMDEVIHPVNVHFFTGPLQLLLNGAMYKVVMDIGMEATYRFINLVFSSLRLFRLYSHR